MQSVSRSRRHALATLLTGAASLPRLALAANTSDWPAGKTINWIVGFAPGGSLDVLTRIAARKLAEKTGSAVIVENRPGASGALALQAAAHAAPDGYTLISVPGPILSRTRQPEIGKELAAVGGLGQGPMVLVGPASNAASTLAEVIAAARKDPKAWNFASSGNGTSQHLAGELMNVMAGTRITHIPYKGGGQAVTDVVGGQVKLGMLGVTPVLAHIQAGKLKAYAVTTIYRIESLPNVPTMQEAGLKGYDATQWYVVAAPRGIPDAYIGKLNSWLSDIAASPEMQAALASSGSVALKGNATDVERFVEADARKWQDLVRRVKLDLD